MLKNLEISNIFCTFAVEICWFTYFMGMTQRMEEPYKQPSDIPYQKGHRLIYTIIKKDETNSYNCSVEDIVWDEWQGVWLLTLKKDIDDFLMNIHVDSKGKPCLQTESVTRVLRDLN